MAEVLGVVASGISIASLALQILDNIQRVKDFCRLVRDAPKDREYIADDLHIINTLLPQIGRIASSLDTSGSAVPRITQQQIEHSGDGHLLIQRSVAHCKVAVDALDNLVSDLHTLLSVNHSRQRRWHSFRAVRRKNEIESIKKEIESAKSTLSLVIDFQSLLLHEQHQNMMKSLFLLMSSTQATESRQIRPNDASPFNERVLDSSSTASQSLIRRQGQSTRKDLACSWRNCRCSCHAVLRAGKRFWFLEAPSLSSLWNACDQISCSRRQYHAYIWIGFTPIGIPFAVSASLVLLASAKVSMTSSLTVERVVKYTSPGFELLWKCRHGELQWLEARETFETFIRSGKATINDVNPSGRTLLEELLKCGWPGLEKRNFQLKLLELLVRMGAKLNRAQLLYNFALRWNTNSSISVIKSLLNYGLDVDDFDMLDARYSLFSQEPGTTSVVSGSFHIELSRVISERSPGFGGNTSLHEAVLLGSHDDVEKCLRETHHVAKTNLVGQSALHFAAARPQHLKKLLDAGLEVDVKDGNGQKPLNYAVRSGDTNVVLQLFAAGADPFEGESQISLSWLNEASFRGHLELIIDALQYILHSPQYDDKSVQGLLDKALASVPRRSCEDAESEHLRRLFDLGADINTRFKVGSSSGNTLLHLGFRSRSVISIIQAGFTGIDTENSEGDTPLMAVARGEHLDLLEIYINHGAYIHHKNRRGWNVLHFLCREMPRVLYTAYYFYQPGTEEETFSQLQPWLDGVKLLILKGANMLDGDACQCQCSQTGCLPQRMFTEFRSVYLCPSPMIWSLEYFTMLQELRTTEEAKTSLLSMLRLARFDRLELTHVCCQRSSTDSSGLPLKDKPLPHEDAQEIITEEEEIIRELELQMADLSTKSYSDLLEFLFQEFRTLALEKVRSAVEFRMKHKRIKRAGIDCRNDRYIYGDYNWPAHVPDDIGIKRYMRWLEYCHQHLKSSHANDEAAEEWYQRRLKWSSRLSEVVEDLHLGEPFEPMYEVAEDPE